MKRGIGGWRTEEERPELNEHYAPAKSKFNGEIGFCTECGEPTCALNRYECHRFAATGEFLVQTRNVPRHKKVFFTFHDFHKTDAIEYFLDNYTTALHPLSHQGLKEPNKKCTK